MHHHHQQQQQQKQQQQQQQQQQLGRGASQATSFKNSLFGDAIHPLCDHDHDLVPVYKCVQAGHNKGCRHLEAGVNSSDPGVLGEGPLQLGGLGECYRQLPRIPYS